MPWSSVLKSTSYDSIERAEEILTLSKGLNYAEIAKHNPEEIEKLKRAITRIGVEARSATSLADEASTESASTKQTEATTRQTAESDDDIDLRLNETVARRADITAQLQIEGMDDRVGQLYSSASDNRRIEFKQAPHHRGIPPFDLVVAPDFAPAQGLHGIFIAQSEVLSIVLPSDGHQDSWTILKRKDYRSLEEMSEYLMLLSAGFDLPV